MIVGSGAAKRQLLVLATFTVREVADRDLRLPLAFAFAAAARFARRASPLRSFSIPLGIIRRPGKEAHSMWTDSPRRYTPDPCRMGRPGSSMERGPGRTACRLPCSRLRTGSLAPSNFPRSTRKNRRTLPFDSSSSRRFDNGTCRDRSRHTLARSDMSPSTRSGRLYAGSASWRPRPRILVRRGRAARHWRAPPRPPARLVGGSRRCCRYL
jgi:hypothetical protein